LIYEEVAFIAYYLHWSPEHVLEFAHPDRRRWVHEISQLNHRINEESRER
jgi:hypothetical protein